MKAEGVVSEMYILYTWGGGRVMGRGGWGGSIPWG